VEKGENVRVERLPFTVYDILGYFIPGFLLLVGLTHFLPDIRPALDTHIAMLSGTFARQAIGVTVVIAASYALGHLVSLLAGLSIERIMVKVVKYPSQYLMDNAGLKRRWYHKEPLGKVAQKRVAIRFKEEFGEELEDCDKGEWFSLIDHYHRCHSPQIAARMYNYVVLYGFLRNTAFVLFVLGFASFSSIRLCPPNAGYFIPIGLFLFGAAAMAGFQKYYRRYSNQALMGFAVSKPDADDSDEKRKE
jgi:hypothetical protein